jgi:hypothetical protein
MYRSCRARPFAGFIVAILLIAPVCVSADNGLAPAVTGYTIRIFGRTAGVQTTSVAADGRVSVEFSYRENGRGPDLHEELMLAADGTPLSLRVSGKSEMGAPIDESFRRTDAGAKWKSLADEGMTESPAATLYVPLNYTFETLSQMVRALTNVPERKLPALPVGTVTAERLQQAGIVNGGVQRTVALYALTGLEYSPTFVWMTEKPELRLFAFIYPGFMQTVESGWESQGDKLESLQKEAEYELLRALAQRLTHHLPDPIVIRNARVFDSEHSRMLPGQHDVYINRGQIAAVYEAGSRSRVVSREVV